MVHIYISNRTFEFRPPATEVVFGESLSGTGTLGNIAGVTESTAKYTGMTKEDPSNPANVAAFDYIAKENLNQFHESQQFGRTWKS